MEKSKRAPHTLQYSVSVNACRAWIGHSLAQRPLAVSFHSQFIEKCQAGWLEIFAVMYTQRADQWTDRGADTQIIASGWATAGGVKSYLHWDWEIRTLPQVIALLGITKINTWKHTDILLSG